MQQRKYNLPIMWYRSSCAWCKKEFQHNKPFALYCSDRCRQAAYRNRLTNLVGDEKQS